MSKKSKKRVLIILAVVITITTVTVSIFRMQTKNNAAQPEVSSEPTPTPVPITQKTVHLTFKYNVPAWIDVSVLPKDYTFVLQRLSYYEWEHYDLQDIAYPNVKMFQLTPTSYDLGAEPGVVKAGCTWDRFMWDIEPESCSDDSVLNLTVEYELEFCYNSGHCFIDDLEIVIGVDNSNVSFMAEGAFSPMYRKWIDEVTSYFGWDITLPDVLNPGVNYVLTK